jgi:hypothetical protein
VREREKRAGRVANKESRVTWLPDTLMYWLMPGLARICRRWNIIKQLEREHKTDRTHTQQIGPALSRSWETENRPWHTFLGKWRFKVWKLAANWNPRKCLYFFIQMQSAMSERSAPLWIFISFFLDFYRFFSVIQRPRNGPAHLLLNHVRSLCPYPAKRWDSLWIRFDFFFFSWRVEGEIGQTDLAIR